MLKTKARRSEGAALWPGAGSTKQQLAATPAACTHKVKVKLLFESQRAPPHLLLLPSRDSHSWRRWRRRRMCDKEAD